MHAYAGVHLPLRLPAGVAMPDTLSCRPGRPVTSPTWTSELLPANTPMIGMGWRQMNVNYKAEVAAGWVSIGQQEQDGTTARGPSRPVFTFCYVSLTRAAPEAEVGHVHHVLQRRRGCSGGL